MVDLSEPRAWLEQAQADLEHARKSLELGHNEWSCYAAQQAAEKCLKAMLLAAGVKPHFTHHLNILAEQIGEHGIELSGLPSKKRLVDLSDKNILARYPLARPPPRWKPTQPG